MGDILRRERKGIADYFSGRRWLLFLSMALCCICYIHNAFSLNIRVDCEGFINEPGTLQGWMSIGRFGQAVLKPLISNLNYNPYYSGLLFIAAFGLGAILWCYLFHAVYPQSRYEWIFSAVYVTSHIWLYMFYFQMMAAEVALGILLVPISLRIVCMANKTKDLTVKTVLSVAAVALLVLAISTYQAIAVMYITGAAACLLLELYANREYSFSLFLRKGISFVISFAVSLLVYCLIERCVRQGNASYLARMIHWGVWTPGECIEAVLEYIGTAIKGDDVYLPTFGVGLATLLAALISKRMKSASVMIAAFVIALSPFLLALLLGNRMLERMQFALPLASAFMLYYAAESFGACCRRVPRSAVALLAVWLSVASCARGMRLLYTDDIRYQQDLAMAERVYCDINDVCGEGVYDCVVFVGKWDAPLNAACQKSDVFGGSLFSWDYSPWQQTLNSDRSWGFMHAALGMKGEKAEEWQRERAGLLAQEMPVYPEDGYISEKEGILIVRLS